MEYVEINPQGRIVIPIQIRKSLGLDSGAKLSVRESDGRIILEDVRKKRTLYIDKFRRRLEETSAPMIDQEEFAPWVKSGWGERS